MQSEVVIDSSPLIDYFRKGDKTKTFYSEIAGKYGRLLLPVIAQMEVMYGAKPEHLSFWNSVFSKWKFCRSRKKLFPSLTALLFS